MLLVGGRASTLSAESLSLIAAVSSPVTVRVFTTPTCPHCPRAVSVAHEMAFANPNITAYAVEATEFPDLARRYHVTGVPKTVVDDARDVAGPIEILGALPPDDPDDVDLADAGANRRRVLLAVPPRNGQTGQSCSHTRFEHSVEQQKEESEG